MWQCPKCGLEVEDSLKWCWICGTSPDGAEYPGYPLAGECPVPPGGLAKTIAKWLSRLPNPSGVPRRFSLGKLMLITAFFAVLFAVLRCLNAHPVVFVVVAGFVTVVGLSQAILFSGKRPRRASVVAGAALGALVPAVGSLVLHFTEGPHLAMHDLAIGAVFFVVATLIYAVVGGILGYLVGCLVAAIFLGKRSTLREASDHPSEPPDPFRPDGPKIGSPADPPGA